jgi:hypothetical protein
MNEFWEAVKRAFGGLIDWYMLVALVGGVVLYALLFLVARHLDDKEHRIRLYGGIVLWLGKHKNRLCRWMAKRVWHRLMELDYERQRQTAENPDKDDNERGLAVRNLSQPKGDEDAERAAIVIRQTLCNLDASEKMTRVAKAALGEIEKCRGQANSRVRGLAHRPP